ncbi:hypothetical protein Mgra_00003450 [Meloidogyne graminicola]|uniref:Uncharacterized protein n=1 Tax=Meloidogyne graminicola TaxID=189291 RepID=A0A8S9ZV21_9BILA|nr:hypothetical protein Mgra_00003450 [Meloidogyne graminicola]
MFNFLNNLIKGNSNGKIQFLSCNCPSKYFWILLILPFIFCLYILIQKWPNNNIIFKNILLENTTNYINECIEEEENNKKWSLQCCGEQMSISFNVETNNKLTENTISGKRFDCKHLQILQKYKLADKYKIEQKIQLIRPGNIKFVIVTAASAEFFQTLRKLFVILKQQFGCSQKIICYDLGGISEDKNMMEEINSICNLEWRKYNWSIMPNNVHSPNAYAWKLYIIAEVYTEYDTFMWVDTSFTIEDVKSLDPIFNSIESGNISETVFPGNAQHSIHFATNLNEKFIPHFHTEHPRKYSKHKILRREKLDNKLDFKKEVACCT